MTLTEYIAKWDPMGFIEELKAPADEYGVEVATIRLNFNAEMSDNELANKIYEIFDERIGVDSPTFHEECIKHAPEIKKILLAEDK